MPNVIDRYIALHSLLNRLEDELKSQGFHNLIESINDLMAEYNEPDLTEDEIIRNQIFEDLAYIREYILDAYLSEPEYEKNTDEAFQKLETKFLEMPESTPEMILEKTGILFSMVFWFYDHADLRGIFQHDLLQMKEVVFEKTDALMVDGAA